MVLYGPMVLSSDTLPYSGLPAVLTPLRFVGLPLLRLLRHLAWLRRCQDLHPLEMTAYVIDVAAVNRLLLRNPILNLVLDIDYWRRVPCVFIAAYDLHRGMLLP